MRRYNLVVCLPSGEMYRNVYFKAIKPCEKKRTRIKIMSFLDSPIAAPFSEEIKHWIHHSNGVIAILSGNNTNVLYEVGLALGFGKPVIPITDSVDTIPAMLKHWSAIHYDEGKPKWSSVQIKVLDSINLMLEGADHLCVDERHAAHIQQLIGGTAAREGIAGGPQDEPATDDAISAGIKHYHKGDFLGAIEVLSEALGRGFRTPELYYYLTDACFLHAEALADQGEVAGTYYSRMLTYAQQGVVDSQHDRRTKKNLGLAYMNLRKLDEAESIFRSLLHDDPHYEHAKYNLACVSSLRRNVFACLERLDELFLKNPTWRMLARTDKDLDDMWRNELFQRLIYPVR